MKWMFTYATIVILPFTYKDLAILPWAEIPATTWFETAFVVFVATYLAYIMMMTGQKLLRPTIVSMYNYVQPIVACQRSHRVRSIRMESGGSRPFGFRRCMVGHPKQKPCRPENRTSIPYRSRILNRHARIIHLMAPTATPLARAGIRIRKGAVPRPNGNGRRNP